MMVDTVSGDGVTVTARAPGARHPECGAIPTTSALIRPGNDVRQGPGRRWPKPASVAVLGQGQAGPRWYVVAVDRRAVMTLGLEPWHAALERSIREAGWEAVVPLFRSAEDQLVPAFPGYGLVEFDVRDPGWRAIPHLRGVRRLIGPADRPMPVADVQAAWVLGQFGPDGFQRRPLERAAMQPVPIGARVRVVGGLGLGWSGEVVESDGRSVMLLVDGRRVRLAQAAVQVMGPSLV